MEPHLTEEGYLQNSKERYQVLVGERLAPSGVGVFRPVEAAFKSANSIQTR